MRRTEPFVAGIVRCVFLSVLVLAVLLSLGLTGACIWGVIELVGWLKSK